MILVTLGTQKEQFTRLLNYIENSNIKDEIIVQAGYTKYKSKKMKIFDFIPYEKMEKYIDDADLVITHSGTGSVLMPLKKGKKVIACARLSKYGEHVDDHQKELIEVFKDEGYILELDENNNLDDLLIKIKKFEPKKYTSNTDQFIKKLKKEINKPKKSSKKILFITIYLLITFIGFLSMFKTPNPSSGYQNRTLAQFSQPTIVGFLDESFQNGFEDAFKDQFVLSDKISMFNNQLSTVLTGLPLNKNICEGKYVKVSNSYYTFDCGDYLVEKYPSWYRDPETISKKIDSYNKIGDYADLYYYFINKSTNFNFETNEKTIDISDYLTQNYSQLEFSNYEEYKNYFYKTDHHWNYKGAYQAYQDIIKMIFGEDEEITKIKDEKVFNVNFYGSAARLSSFTAYKENFAVYTFDMKDYDVYIDRKLGTFGYEDLYMNGEYETNIWKNHYAAYYGGDYPEVIFDFKDNSKENLLILSNSFSNAPSKLIAQHFNKTYMIDLRYYENEFNEPFNYKDYINKNNIDKVLVICDPSYIVSGAFNIKEEF